LSIVGLVPLRAGGKRVGLIDGLDKERATMGNHSLMAWTIASAKDSGIFDEIVAITASYDHADVAKSCGIKYAIRPNYTALDNSPDIEWVSWFFSVVEKKYDAFAILRVTSPFRSAATIRAAWGEFRTTPGAHSLRAVRRVSEHPGKMWVIRHGYALPLLPAGDPFEPWHSQPTQNLPDVYIQTAGLEMAWTKVVQETRTIAGSVVLPWVLEEPEALDINTRDDWDEAIALVEAGLVKLPTSIK